MGLFDKIAPIYGLFFKNQVKYFKKIQNRTENKIDLSQYKTVLDIGCGTGALAKTLYDRGLKITGVDVSEGMIDQAKKKLKDTDIKLLTINPEEDLPFPDKSFDLIITSYVLHGLQAKERLELYNEMKRIAKHRVIIHEYNKNRRLITDIIEWLEGGDYFNFIQIAKEEMETVFGEVEVIDVDTRAAWYICHCKKGEFKWIKKC